MDQIFNELSANGSYTNKYAANVGMERMLRLSNGLGKCGFSRDLRVIEGFNQLSIAPGYSIVQWAMDKSIGADRELQRQLLTSATKAPYVEHFISDAEQDDLYEFKFCGHTALGLGLAYLWGSSVLSLDGDARFSPPNIDVEFYQLHEDSESTETVSVCSVSSLDQLKAVCHALKNAQIANVENGKSLVEQFSVLFSSLACGNEAAKQLSALSGSEQFFQEIIRHFSILNATMQSWNEGPFNPQGITWSPESEPTLKQFAKSRLFVCADDVSRQFSLHTKILSANQRIHYYPELKNKIVHIGYIGKHLPTVRHRT